MKHYLRRAMHLTSHNESPLPEYDVETRKLFAICHRRRIVAGNTWTADAFQFSCSTNFRMMHGVCELSVQNSFLDTALYLWQIQSTVADRGRPVPLLQFAQLSLTESNHGRYQFGRRWYIRAALQQRPLPTRGPAPVWCLDRRRRPPLRREEKDAHHLIFFPTLLHLTMHRYVPR